MRVLLSRRPDLDAVFCANDLMAAGALRVLREAGLDVPGDVSVVGFDDAPLAQSTHPPLTTVHQSPEQMGREMVALLLDTMRTHTSSARPPRPEPRLLGDPARRSASSSSTDRQSSAEGEPFLHSQGSSAKHDAGTLVMRVTATELFKREESHQSCRS